MVIIALDETVYGSKKNCNKVGKMKHHNLEAWISLYKSMLYAKLPIINILNILVLYKCMVNVLKFQTLLFLFSNKMWVIRAGIHKIPVRVANREGPNQTGPASALIARSGRGQSVSHFMMSLF